MMLFHDFAKKQVLILLFDNFTGDIMPINSQYGQRQRSLIVWKKRTWFKKKKKKTSMFDRSTSFPSMLLYFFIISL